jgi:hypothetical protein
MMTDEQIWLIFAAGIIALFAWLLIMVSFSRASASHPSEEPKLELDDVRKLEDGATQTRFTWAVIFLTFITALIGLLPMTESLTGTSKPLFNGTISFIYFILTIGVSYTFFAICKKFGKW